MQASLPTMQARTGRGTQLALTLFAVTLSVGAYVLVTLGKTGKTPPGIAGFVAVLNFTVRRFAGLRWLSAGPDSRADPELVGAARVRLGMRSSTSLAADRRRVH